MLLFSIFFISVIIISSLKSLDRVSGTIFILPALYRILRLNYNKYYDVRISLKFSLLINNIKKLIYFIIYIIIKKSV